MTPRDMDAANWARTLARLRRNIEELRSYDCQVTEPPNFDRPPSARGLRAGGMVRGPVATLLGDQGPEHLVNRRGDPL